MTEADPDPYARIRAARLALPEVGHPSRSPWNQERSERRGKVAA